MARLILSLSIFVFVMVGMHPCTTLAAQSHHADPSLLDGHRYGPVRKEDTLWSIALLMRHKHESINKVMDELIAANAEAFAGKGRALKPGAYLHRGKDLHVNKNASLNQAKGSDIADYLAERNPVITREMPDNGYSPDPIPFSQALESSSLPILNTPSLGHDSQETKNKEQKPNLNGLSDKTLEEMNDNGRLNHAKPSGSENETPFLIPFFSGMLGGLMVLLGYSYLFRRDVKDYRLSGRRKAGDQIHAVAGEESEADLMTYHPSTRTRNPNDPVIAPSEQDILNWSKSLAATQVMTNSDELQSNRLNQPR